ncbi:MAG TPA: radical SAM protein [Chthonomonadales bacterium]|nr:radical SAM protein [Chthonomonadales bacterium]
MSAHCERRAHARPRVFERSCRSILNTTRDGFADYTLNVYQGCAFGCTFCYVPVLRRRRGQPDPAAWGAWVEVKTNAPDVLRRQMLRIPGDASIAIGTAADSWQPIERTVGLARAVLQELAYYPNPVHIATRSPLLLRDVDILKRMRSVEVAVSLTGFDDTVRRAFEPMAPTIPARERMIGRLVDEGIAVALFWCPLLPGISDTAEAIDRTLSRAAGLGVRRVVAGRLSYARELGSPFSAARAHILNDVRPPQQRGLSPGEFRERAERWSRQTRVPVTID